MEKMNALIGSRVFDKHCSIFTMGQEVVVLELSLYRLQPWGTWIVIINYHPFLGRLIFFDFWVNSRNLPCFLDPN